MFRSDIAGQLCLSLPGVPSNFAKDNRPTNSAQEVMVSGVRNSLYFLSVSLLHQKRNAPKITEGQLRTVSCFLWAHGLCIMQGMV